MARPRTSEETLASPRYAETHAPACDGTRQRIDYSPGRARTEVRALEVKMASTLESKGVLMTWSHRNSTAHLDWRGTCAGFAPTLASSLSWSHKPHQSQSIISVLNIIPSAILSRVGKCCVLSGLGMHHLCKYATALRTAVTTSSLLSMLPARSGPA